MSQDTQEQNAELLRTFAWRLGNIATRKGMEQSDIADRLGITLSRVNNWFQGKNYPRRSERPKLASLLGVTVEFLIHGVAENGQVTPEGVAERQDELGGTPVRQIPVISWSHAGEAATYEEMPRHFHGMVATTSRDARAFAVTIEGDSMEPKFFAGDRVVCEPSRAPTNGKTVVAKFREDESVQLRVYHRRATGDIQLASLNPEIYPTETYPPDSFAWIYPVRELVRMVS